MENIVVIGSSGHAKVVLDILQLEEKFNVVGLLDRFRPVGAQALGYTILGSEEDLPQLIGAHALGGALIAIGDNFVRSAVAARINQLCPDLRFVTAVHPRAIIASDVAIGEGTVVMAGAAVNPGCQIGRFCILNTHCSLDHDSALGDFASLAPGTTTGGSCRIGVCTAIGIGATLRHGISVGEHSVIGAGALVLTPLGDFVLAYGAPAKVICSRNAGGKYL